MGDIKVTRCWVLQREDGRYLQRKAGWVKGDSCEEIPALWCEDLAQALKRPTGTEHAFGKFETRDDRPEVDIIRVSVQVETKYSRVVLSRFNAWLWPQAGRDGPIGELARAAASDSTWPDSAAWSTYWGHLGPHLGMSAPCAAFRKAWAEYQRWYKERLK